MITIMMGLYGLCGIVLLVWVLFGSEFSDRTPHTKTGGCAESRYQIPLKGITFGMPQSEALRALKLENPKVTLTSTKTEIKITYPKSLQDPFKSALLRVAEGSVAGFEGTYSRSFLEKNGGSSESATWLILSASDKYGEPVEKKTEFVGVFGWPVEVSLWRWERHNGVGFALSQVFLELTVAYACAPTLKQQAAKNKNLRF
jgi:hypothetical protein